jgi:hypothetical protein
MFAEQGIKEEEYNSDSLVYSLVTQRAKNNFKGNTNFLPRDTLMPQCAARVMRVLVR